MAGAVTEFGNLTDDVELRYTQSGRAVANFTVACNRDVRDSNAEGGYRKEEALFLPCTLWGPQAENFANSVEKGMHVMVHGSLKPDTFETRDGGKRTVIKCEVKYCGPTVLRQVMKVSKVVSDKNGEQR